MKALGNEMDDITLPATRKDFWEFLISLHPGEEVHAPSTKNAQGSNRHITLCARGGRNLARRCSRR
jgi:hypothetical protein